MLFTMIGKHIDITDGMRAHAKQKIDKLPRFFDQLSHVEVVIDGSVGTTPVVEVVGRAEHFGDIVAKEAGPDVYTCIDMAVHKLERQLKKVKEKQRDNKHVATDQPIL